MGTPDLDQELQLLAQAAHDSQRELERLTARLAERARIGTVRDLHDLKTHLTYLRLLLRSVARAASSTPTIHGLWRVITIRPGDSPRRAR